MRVSVPASEEAGSPAAWNVLTDRLRRAGGFRRPSCVQTSAYTDPSRFCHMNDSLEQTFAGKKAFVRGPHPTPPGDAGVPPVSLPSPAAGEGREGAARRPRSQDGEIVAMRLSGQDLACIRGGRRVFAAVSFSITGGQALVLTGPNGAGKSSLLRMIAGLIRPVEGSVGLEGGDPELSVGE